MSGVTSERRSSPRAALDLPLKISPHAQAQPARLKDISASGLCCLFGDPLDEMTVVGIDLDLPGAGQVKAKGAVVRCDKRRGTSPPTYEIAVYFTELPPAARSTITAFVLARLAQGLAPAAGRAARSG